MAGEVDDYEMDHFGEEWMNTEGNTDETSFTDRDQTMVQPNTDNNTVTVGSANTNSAKERAYTSADDQEQDRNTINSRKKFFTEELGMTVNKSDGKASRELLEQSHISYNKGSGKIDGIFFKSVKVMIRKKGKITPNENRSNKKVIEVTDEYRDLLEEADNEHFRRLEGAVEKANGSPTTLEAMDDIISQVGSESESVLNKKEENLQEQARGLLTEDEVREFMGMLEPQGTSVDRIRFLEIEANYYREQAANEGDPRKRRLYEKFSEVAEMKADTIRIRIGDAPQHIDVISIINDKVENNDLNRLESFKKWAKKNMVGLSAIAITIAGIITTIVVAARGVVSGGARAVGGFAKALANLGKSLGPLLAPLFSLIAQVLTWGAKGIAWLANNLWVLAIAMTWLLYDYWKNRK